MNYQWNWTDFFRQDVQPSFLLESTPTESWHALVSLPFVPGLKVIVASVPAFAQNHWNNLCAHLTSYCDQHRHIDDWLLVGQMMRDHLWEVQELLTGDIQRAAARFEHWLTQQDYIGQFALVACLHHCTQDNMQARMLLHYLLENHDANSQQIQTMLRFYHSLTERQKDVVILTAYGLTNQEIAEALCIEPSVVAEHLTAIFSKFQDVIQFCPDKHGTRYRLIHWMTCLLIHHPDLAFGRNR